MKMITKLLLSTALLGPGAMLGAISAQAQAVALADVEGAVRSTKAYNTAMQQVVTTYKAQLDQSNARATAIQAELKPLVDALDTNHDNNLDDQEIAAARTANRPELASLQQKQTAAQQELGRIRAPIARAEEFVLEQITPKLSDAVKSAMAKKGVQILLKPGVQFAATPAADLTPTIVAELDALVPTANATPPANWQPGQAAAGAAPAGTTTPATPPRRPQGR